MSTAKEMKTAEEWDRFLTCQPMTPKESLKSVRIKPDEIRAIQADVLEWVEAVMLTEPTAIDAYDTICKKHAELTKGKE